jgi:invasion protein IalB
MRTHVMTALSFVTLLLAAVMLIPTHAVANTNCQSSSCGAEVQQYGVHWSASCQSSGSRCVCPLTVSYPAVIEYNNCY